MTSCMNVLEDICVGWTGINLNPRDFLQSNDLWNPPQRTMHRLFCCVESSTSGCRSLYVKDISKYKPLQPLFHPTRELLLDLLQDCTVNLWMPALNNLSTVNSEGQYPTQRRILRWVETATISNHRTSGNRPGGEMRSNERCVHSSLPDVCAASCRIVEDISEGKAVKNLSSVQF